MRDHLVAHIRAQNGERTYECDMCEKRFICNHLLVAQIRAHWHPTQQKDAHQRDRNCSNVTYVDEGRFRRVEKCGDTEKLQAVQAVHYFIACKRGIWPIDDIILKMWCVVYSRQK